MRKSPLYWLIHALAAFSCEQQDTLDLPRVAVESRYIEYSTWADDSVLCMDDLLRGLDDYIDETAAFLEIEPPTRKIRYVWVPEPIKSAENWLCQTEGPLIGCVFWDMGKVVIFSANPDHHHELVHAVSIGGLGPAHPLLEEGLAMHLGDFKSTLDDLEDFPAKFRRMLDRGPIPDSYPLASHYVASVIDRHGIEEFKTLMQRLPHDANFDGLTEVHADVYGEDLDDALTAMDVPIPGRLQPRCDGEPVAWEGGDDLQVTLQGTCGDGRLYGSGFVAGYPAFYKEYVLEVPTSGVYTMTVTNAEDVTAPSSGSMTSCPGVEPGIIGSMNGEPSPGLLQKGLHSLTIGFPQGPEARGEVSVSLRFQGDPNAAHVGVKQLESAP
jgi:hypothetical protein